MTGLLIPLLAATSAAAVELTPPQLLPYFEAGRFPAAAATAGDSAVVCRYQLFEPPNREPGRKYPLILWLHGYGEAENTDDNRGQLQHVELLFDDLQHLQAAEFYVLAVQCPPQMTRWFHNEGPKGGAPNEDPADEPGEIAVALLDTLIADRAVDPDAVTVVGISAGGTAAWEMGMRAAGRFAALAPLAAGEGDRNRVDRLVDVPIWCFHMRGDVGTPVGGVRRMVASVRRHGGRIALTEYDGTGHASWERALRTDRLRDWLLAQRRGSLFSPAPGTPPWRISHVVLQVAIPVIIGAGWMYERRRRRATPAAAP